MKSVGTNHDSNESNNIQPAPSTIHASTADAAGGERAVRKQGAEAVRAQQNPGRLLPEDCGEPRRPAGETNNLPVPNGMGLYGGGWKMCLSFAWLSSSISLRGRKQRRQRHPTAVSDRRRVFLPHCGHLSINTSRMPASCTCVCVLCCVCWRARLTCRSEQRDGRHRRCGRQQARGVVYLLHEAGAQMAAEEPGGQLRQSNYARSGGRFVNEGPSAHTRTRLVTHVTSRSFRMFAIH